MSLSNPLPAIWQAVSVDTDAYKITIRVLVRSPSHPHTECQQALENFQRNLREDTLFEGKKALSLLQTTNGKPSQEREEIEGLLVLGLWATFERFLRDYLLEKGTVLKQIQPAPFADSLYKQFAKNVERWEPRDILDLLKDSLFTTPILADLIGEAKHILDYRNKVAHANPKKRDSRRQIYSTYEKLNEIINILLQY
jgi:hypothetical protein